MIARLAQVQLEKALSSGKVVILLGARQVGKTTLVETFMRDKKAVLLNFDYAPDVAKFQAAALLPLPDAMAVLGHPSILVLDEAQRLPDAAKTVKGWYDKKVPVQILLLGSSSLDLASKSAESLTGRNRKCFLPPLTLPEILSQESWYHAALSPDIVEQAHAAEFKHTLLKSMVFGCYPEVVTSTDKVAVIRELVRDYLWKDALQIGLVRSPEPMCRLLTLLAAQIGSEVSINELATQLQLSRQTVDRYLDLLEQTFIIFRLSAFGSNVRKEVVKSKKVYFWDTGIRNGLLNQMEAEVNRGDIGNLFENFMVAEFAKRNLLNGRSSDLFFWRTHSQAEVDLVVKTGGKLNAFEFKWGGKQRREKAFFSVYGVETVTLSAAHPATILTAMGDTRHRTAGGIEK